jgi:hypothetical protein
MNRMLPQPVIILAIVWITVTHQLSGQPAGVRISDGTVLFASGSGTMVVNNGNFLNDGSFVASAENTFIMEGNSPQSFAGTNESVFGNLIINNPGGISIDGAALSIRSVLKCNGPLNTNGNLVLLSTSERTGLIDGSGTGTVTGDVTLQRYLSSGSGYKYISSAFQSATIAELGDDIDLLSYETDVYSYDESRTSSGWIYYKDESNPMIPLAGYAVNLGSDPAPKTLDIKGTVNDGPVSGILYNHNNAMTQGFNLVGNPYPSPIDWDAASGWIRSNIDNAVYFFRSSDIDQYGGSYSTYLNGISSDGVASAIIPSMQGFFVHVSDGAFPVTGTFSVDNSARVTSLNPTFLKSAASTGKSLLRLTAGFSDDTISFDPFVIYYDENATPAFDGTLDAIKLFNTDMAVVNFYVFSSDGRKLSIDALPITGDTVATLRLGLKMERAGKIDFHIKDCSGIYKNMALVLTDRGTNQQTELTISSSYSVDLPAGDYQDRFFLNLGSIKSSIIDPGMSTGLFNAYCTHGVLKIESGSDIEYSGILEIFDLSGRLCHREPAVFSGYNLFYPDLLNGLYVVRILSGGEAKTRQVFFHD